MVRILHDAVDSARAEAEARNLTIEVDSPSSLSAQVRPEAVRRALDNLLSNALKHARSEVRVAVSLSDARELVLSVRDDGPGIPEAEEELVFQPFHRVPGSPHGAGLGLALVREVASLHDGRAYVKRGPNGAELVLELKAA
jgi:signal transduction histidine kinase